MDETDFVRSRRRAVFEPPPARPQSNASADDDISSLSPYGRHVIMRGRRAGGRLSGDGGQSNEALGNGIEDTESESSSSDSQQNLSSLVTRVSGRGGAKCRGRGSGRGRGSARGQARARGRGRGGDSVNQNSDKNVDGPDQGQGVSVPVRSHVGHTVHGQGRAPVRGPRGGVYDQDSQEHERDRGRHGRNRSGVNQGSDNIQHNVELSVGCPFRGCGDRHVQGQELGSVRNNGGRHVQGQEGGTVLGPGAGLQETARGGETNIDHVGGPVRGGGGRHVQGQELGSVRNNGGHHVQAQEGGSVLGPGPGLQETARGGGDTNNDPGLNNDEEYNGGVEYVFAGRKGICSYVNNYEFRFLGSLVPGTRKTYHELLVYGIRDYIIEKQIPYPKLKWASVVNFIKVQSFFL